MLWGNQSAGWKDGIEVRLRVWWNFTEVKDGGFQNQYINERGKKREDCTKQRYVPCRHEIGKPHLL
jgi:hypothetical protein